MTFTLIQKLYFQLLIFTLTRKQYLQSIDLYSDPETVFSIYWSLYWSRNSISIYWSLYWSGKSIFNLLILIFILIRKPYFQSFDLYSDPETVFSIHWSLLWSGNSIFDIFIRIRNNIYTLNLDLLKGTSVVIFKGVLAKNERGYRRTAENKRFWSLPATNLTSVGSVYNEKIVENDIKLSHLKLRLHSL